MQGIGVEPSHLLYDGGAPADGLAPVVLSDASATPHAATNQKRRLK